MPDIEKGDYLIDYLYEIGTSKSGANGAVPIDWVDIKAWSDLTGVRLTREEALIIKGLSSDFVSQMSRSRNPNEPSPYLPAQSNVSRMILFQNHPAYKDKH